MKLAAIFLLVAGLTASAGGHSQGITLKVKDKPLARVLEDIERQSAYSFVYAASVIQQAKPVSVEVNNAGLDETLRLCFKDQPLTYSIIEKTIVIKAASSLPDGGEQTTVVNEPPPIDVKGRVVNENGEPVIATVTVKGTKNAVTTDANGYFILEGVDVNATLVISSVSIEQTLEVKVNGKSDLGVLIVKPKVITGEDVTVKVNTGYQELPKERVTGSFATVSNKQFNQLVSTDILSRLEPMVTGLAFGKRYGSTSPPLRIRGVSTINASANPLIIIDNFPYEGDLNNINPNDIESITVLKDAAAASIWGPRAGNGVIVVTTKRGTFSQPLRVEFNSNLRIFEKQNIFYRSTISTSEEIDLELLLFQRGYAFADTNNIQRPSFSELYEMLFARRRGSISSSDSAEFVNSLRHRDFRNEYNKYFNKTGVNQQHAINFRGGSQNIAWNLSFGYDRNINHDNATYERFTVSSNNTMRFLKKWQLETGIKFTNSTSKSGSPDFQSFLNKVPPYTLFADEYGKPVPFYDKYRKSYIDTAGGGKLLDWNYYPLNDHQHNKTITSLQDIVLKTGLIYEIFKGLRVSVNYQYERQSMNAENNGNLQSFEVRDLINRFTVVSRTSAPDTFRIPRGSILTQSLSELTSQQLRGQINFDRTWNRHSIIAIAGGDLRESSTRNRNSRIYGLDEEMMIFGNVDYTRSYPTYITGAPGLIPNANSIRNYLNRSVSIFGNAAYTFNGRYTLSLSARKDASNLFGVKTNNRWRPLWSGGVMWDISKESYFDSRLVTSLKLRFTYGYSGNMNPNLSALTTISYFSNLQPYTLTPYANFNTYYNPELRWETVGTTNLGIDFRFFDDRVRGSLDLYRKKSTDLYGPSVLDYTGGVGNRITKNIASILVKGIDLELNTLNVDQEIKWTTTLRFSTNKDEVLDYFLATTTGNAYTTDGGSVKPVKGGSVYGLYSYRWAGLDPSTGDPLGYLSNRISKDYNLITGSGTNFSDMVYHGSAIPRVFGSIGNTISWRNLSLSLGIIYKMGYYFRASSVSYNTLFLTSQGHGDFSRRWQKPGDELITNVPSLVYPGNARRDDFYTYSEILVNRGDHVRLQFINLSYNLDKSVLHKLKADAIEAYVNINDIGLLWRANNLNIDPEYSSTSIPVSVNAVLGVRIRF